MGIVVFLLFDSGDWRLAAEISEKVIQESKTACFGWICPVLGQENS
jgi:hypothetical protein